MAPKNWDSDEERRPDPHDSAMSVGTNNTQGDDTAKMRELEVELHNMTDKVASACKYIPLAEPTDTQPQDTDNLSQPSASQTTKTTSAS
jgi:hypothetical protein